PGALLGLPRHREVPAAARRRAHEEKSRHFVSAPTAREAGCPSRCDIKCSLSPETAPAKRGWGLPAATAESSSLYPAGARNSAFDANRGADVWGHSRTWRVSHSLLVRSERLLPRGGS